MRLFPHPWEGLHPAFPSNPSPSDSTFSVGPPISHESLAFLSSGSYGVCALACTLVSAKRGMSMPTRKTLGFLVKTTLLATTLGIANTANNELTERRLAPIFLRSRQIEPPSFKVADRLWSWDEDNWTVLGGVAGLLAARRRLCPLPTVSRPLWYALHMLAGYSVASLGYRLQQLVILGPKLDSHRAMNEKQVLALQKASYQPELAREYILDILTSIPAALTQAQVGAFRLSPEMIAALKERTNMRLFGPRSSAKVLDGQENIVELILDPSNASDGFHRTMTPPGEFEPVPYASRNYNWSCSPQQAQTSPELEKHIAQLRKQRQQLCNEAESVRDWLYKREAAYYKLEATSDTDTSALKLDKDYLTMLGRWYLSTWLAVSEYDWMLADAANHLAFTKATQQGLEWPPAHANKPATVKLEHMLVGLNVHLKTLHDLSRQLPDTLAQLKKALSEATKANQPHYGAIEQQIRSLEQLQRKWDEEREVTRRVLADASARSETSDEVSTTR